MHGARRHAGEEKEDNREGLVVCAICLEEAGGKDGQGTGQLDGCRHTFCFSCILQWSRVTNVCPLCKAKFTRLAQEPPAQGGVSQSVLTVTDKEQQPQYDQRELLATYEGGDSFIDDRSDSEIEREAEAGEDRHNELRWFQREAEGGDDGRAGKTVVFSQDGRRLRNTRARKRRVPTLSQERPTASQGLSRTTNNIGHEGKRSRLIRQSTVAEILQRRFRRQRRHGPSEDPVDDYIILLDADPDELVDTRADEGCSAGGSESVALESSGSLLPGDGSSSEQYTPTQLWERHTHTTASHTTAAIPCLPSSQQSFPPSLTPLQLSPCSPAVLGDSPSDSGLSSCFPLPRTLGLPSSSQASAAATLATGRKANANQRPRSHRTVRSSWQSSCTRSRGPTAEKENRPNVPRLFFSCLNTPTPTSATSAPSRSSSAPPSINTAASPPCSSSSSPSSSTPSLLSQHQFQALSAVRAQLMPFFKKNVLSSSEFRDIAKKVCEDYLSEELCHRELATKPLCLTPRRKQKIRHLVERQLQTRDQASSQDDHTRHPGDTPGSVTEHVRGTHDLDKPKNQI